MRPEREKQTGKTDRKGPGPGEPEKNMAGRRSGATIETGAAGESERKRPKARQARKMTVDRTKRVDLRGRMSGAAEPQVLLGRKMQ